MLAAWATSADNRLFVESQVNRIWYHLLGRGIVDPIDDFRATNPAVNPALLAELSKDFVEHGFRLKHLVRVIMNSSTYQLSAVPNETNADDQAHFAHALPRRISAEQLLDALAQVTDVQLEFDGFPAGTRAGQLPGSMSRRRDPEPAEKFLRVFGKPPRLTTCECERSTESTLAQTLQLISGSTIQELLSAKDNRLGQLLSSKQSDSEIVTEFYWSALGRAPSEMEIARTTEYLSNATDRRSALEDIVWGLVNSQEFLLRR